MRLIITLNILTLIGLIYLISVVKTINNISDENRRLITLNNKTIEYMNDMVYDQNKKINQAYDTLIKRKK